jgi:2-dehydropantoate 2-reductase
MARHAILGAGGVGGLIGALLAQHGDQVTLVVRPDRIHGYPMQLSLQSPFGNVTVPVSVASRIESDYDVLWITVKATQLEGSLRSVKRVEGIGAVVPLLNGIDHVARLRRLFGQDRVVPATIAVETERVSPGHIVHRSPFARLNLASFGRDRLQTTIDALSGFGFECKFIDSEATLLWSKLSFLAPFALTTSASGLPIGGVKDDPIWRGRLAAIAEEATAVGRAGGATLDTDALLKVLMAFPPDGRSSMQKDVAAGLPPELDAIAGPIIRGGEAHGLPTPVTREMAQVIQTKLKAA